MARVKLIRRPPPPNQQATVIRTQAKAAVRRLVEEVADRHREYVSPWERSEDQPAFTVRDESTRGRVRMVVEMEADAAESASLSVWQLLDRGTSVRYMQLSDDWSSKTTPGATSSGPGAGHKVGLDVNNPQPGIEPREIAAAIAELFDPDGTVRDGYTDGFDRNFR